ncbi:pirin-like C-terminal cupin domain-containing protein [Neisseria bacilliformis]|uniref:pirin-like C-terminal cupin domain-containing protein n=1 Tax=Neisseria bacilliformis TaxID=267212 RepID=UPI0028F012C0|nr:pirin-like C-terminal cupin domain-containing protein [Neisseria bacilliformis]
MTFLKARLRCSQKPFSDGLFSFIRARFAPPRALHGERAISPSQLAVFEREAGGIRIRNTGSGTAELLLSGLPIDEPVAAYGPFVMNTRAELAESIREYNAGKYGSLD